LPTGHDAAFPASTADPDTIIVKDLTTGDVVSLWRPNGETRSVEQHGVARVSRGIGAGIGVALVGALVGVVLGVVIFFGYRAVVNLEPEPSITALRWLEVATLLLLVSWAIVVAAVMVILQRWWRGSPAVSVVAAIVVLIVGGWLLISFMSFNNACEAGHSYPLSGWRC
jgi:hypothetical protein